jgi:hypothetical protein
VLSDELIPAEAVEMIWTKAKRSRKPRRCQCGRWVQKGEVYLEHVASPWTDEVDNATWRRLVECEDCCRQYSRGALIEERKKRT